MLPPSEIPLRVPDDFDVDMDMDVPLPMELEEAIEAEAERAAIAEAELQRAAQEEAQLRREIARLLQLDEERLAALAVVAQERDAVAQRLREQEQALSQRENQLIIAGDELRTAVNDRADIQGYLDSLRQEVTTQSEGRAAERAALASTLTRVSELESQRAADAEVLARAREALFARGRRSRDDAEMDTGDRAPPARRFVMPAPWVPPPNLIEQRLSDVVGSATVPNLPLTLAPTPLPDFNIMEN